MEPIVDEILFLVRDYRHTYAGAPNLLIMSPENIARLREELEIDSLDSFERYHGMNIEVTSDGGYDYLEVSYEI